MGFMSKDDDDFAQSDKSLGIKAQPDMSLETWVGRKYTDYETYYTNITEPNICPDPTVVVPGSLCWYDSGSPTVPDWKLGTLSGWSSSQDADPYAIVVRENGTVGSYYQRYISFANQKPDNKDE